MELFYVITLTEADLIGEFDVSVHQSINPYAGALTNGTYGIRKDDVDSYSERPEIQAVDWTGKVAVDGDTLDFISESSSSDSGSL